MQWPGGWQPTTPDAALERGGDPSPLLIVSNTSTMGRGVVLMRSSTCARTTQRHSARAGVRTMRCARPGSAPKPPPMQSPQHARTHARTHRSWLDAAMRWVAERGPAAPCSVPRAGWSVTVTHKGADLRLRRPCYPPVVHCRDVPARPHTQLVRETTVGHAYNNLGADIGKPGGSSMHRCTKDCRGSALLALALTLTLTLTLALALHPSSRARARTVHPKSQCHKCDVEGCVCLRVHYHGVVEGEAQGTGLVDLDLSNPSHCGGIQKFRPFS